MTRVIVVDDDPKIRTVAKILLEDAGIDVIEADGGTEAIRAFRELGADLVLCDLFMPDVDGIEVIRTLRRDFPDVQVIAMSGGGFGGAVDLLLVARVLGATEVLEKPFTQRSVLAAIARALTPPTGEG